MLVRAVEAFLERVGPNARGPCLLPEPRRVLQAAVYEDRRPLDEKHE
jgi:hypothetical protein